MSFDAPPPIQPSTIQVQGASDHLPYFLLGIIAHGSGADIARLENAISHLGMVGGRPKSEGNSPEEMVFFQATTVRADAFGMIRRARSGEFGPLKIEVMLVPVSAAFSGPVPIDMIDAEPVEFIVGDGA